MNPDLYLGIFGTGVVAGISISIWVTRVLDRFRGPSYYHLRALRASRRGQR